MSPPKHALNRDRELHDLIVLTEHLHEMLHIALERLNHMSAELDRLAASIDALTTAEKQLVALVGTLADEIRANATDPAALVALADKVDADTAEILQAVSNNTTANTAAPVEAAPVETAPAETAPVEAAPVEAAPVVEEAVGTSDPAAPAADAPAADPAA